MKLAYLLLSFTAANFANAGEVLAGSVLTSGTYKVESISNTKPCGDSEVRAPNSQCLAKPVKIPEDITFKIIPDGHGGQNFEMASSCMKVKGAIKFDKMTSMRLKETSVSDHCAGKEISLYHEAAFNRLPEVHVLQKMADGSYRAAADGMSGLMMRPVQ